MIHKLLLVLSVLFSLAVLPAQPQPPTPTPPPAPAPASPPYLDEPAHWQIHDERGATRMRVEVEYGHNNGWADVYYLTYTGVDRNGNPISSWAVAYDWNDGQDIQVYNGDSGLWTTWEWEGDHYVKVGGTENRRSFYPID